MSSGRDRGMAIALVAISMTVLMIFAAFAIDLGAARTARRKAQGTVDGGTLAGGQLLVSADGALTSPDPDDVADEIIDITYRNLVDDAALTDAGSLSPEEWRARFTSCSDPDRDAARYPDVWDDSDCISFGGDMTRVRVRLPDLDVDTYFASVIGMDVISVAAVAEAELVPANSGGVLPFGMLAGATGPEICLKTSSNPTLPPCDRPEAGNFGTLNFRFFGNPELGTPPTCDGDEVIRLSVNIALGIDHRLSTYATGLPVLHDADACPDLSLRPNQVDGRPGMTAQTLDDGLVEGIDADDSPNGRAIAARLAGGPWATRTVRGGSDPDLLDDQPLWEFIPSDLSGSVPDLCRPSVTTIDSKADMAACIAAYDPTVHSDPIFTADVDSDGVIDILRSPRLAWVPRFVESAWGSGRKDYKIAAFVPVFLQTVYFGCSSTCTGVFDPGETGTGLPLADNNSTKSEALTAFLLPTSSLPAPVLDRGPAGGDLDYTLVLRR